MKFTLFKSLLCALFITSYAHNVAAAAPITIDFSGSLTDSFDSFNVGDAFSGSYTFDPGIAAGLGSTSSFSTFNNLLSANVQIGSFSASIGPGVGLPNIQQDDVANADRYAFLALNPVGSSQIGGLDITAFGFRLDDTTGSAVTDALTLLTAPTLSSFTSSGFLFFFDSPPLFGSNFHVLNGTLSSLEVRPAAVPVPATVWLMGSALVGLLLTGKRSKGNV
ncbi:MAG: hypothetical protein WC782_04910 [Methylococcaceae bacterium]|jgi:hypothetical protein